MKTFLKLAFFTGIGAVIVLAVFFGRFSYKDNVSISTFDNKLLIEIPSECSAATQYLCYDLIIFYQMKNDCDNWCKSNFSDSSYAGKLSGCYRGCEQYNTLLWNNRKSFNL